MTARTQDALEAAWAAGVIRPVGQEVEGEANVQDLLDSHLNRTDGGVVTGPIILNLVAAPADATLAANELVFWWDQANSRLAIKAKIANGTVKTGYVTLT